MNVNLHIICISKGALGNQKEHFHFHTTPQEGAVIQTQLSEIEKHSFSNLTHRQNKHEN